MTLVLLVLVLSAASAGLSSSADVWRPLYRPLKIPHIEQSASCPVSPVAKDVDFRSFGIGTGYGRGPAYRLRFDGGSPPPAELRIPRSASSRGRDRLSFTRIKEPGCYGYQVDGTNFGRIVVFEAVRG
jgi:hypothetical protein